jgi:hypothetical protein
MAIAMMGSAHSQEPYLQRIEREPITMFPWNITDPGPLHLPDECFPTWFEQ